MPSIKDIQWWNASRPTGKEDEPGTTFTRIVSGQWENYQCHIIPQNLLRNTYQATIAPFPRAHHQPIRNSHLTAEQAIQWCLETMEQLQEGEAERVQQARQFQEESDRNNRQAMEFLEFLVGLKPSNPEEKASRCRR